MLLYRRLLGHESVMLVIMTLIQLLVSSVNNDITCAMNDLESTILNALNVPQMATCSLLLQLRTLVCHPARLVTSLSHQSKFDQVRAILSVARVAGIMTIA